MADAVASPLLSVQGLVTEFAADAGAARAVDRVSFDLFPGRVTALVGESGCGKSAAALSIMRLIRPPGRIAAGQVWFQGRDLLQLPEREMRRVRGDRIAMIFQEPMTSLNPTMRVGAQVAEAVTAHRRVRAKEANDIALRALADVGLPAAEDLARRFPHELSGGMRQRVMIAMALACEPDLLIADEPTTALDVTIQAQILELLLELRDRRGLAILLITHDLGVVAECADDVLVMYAGRIVEHSPAPALFERPAHPYVADLLKALPDPAQPGRRLHAIPGAVPSLLDLPPGCRYAPRCSLAGPACREREPELIDIGDGRRCACFRAQSDASDESVSLQKRSSS